MGVVACSSKLQLSRSQPEQLCCTLSYQVFHCPSVVPTCLVEVQRRHPCGGTAPALPVHEVVPVQRAEERLRRAERGGGARRGGRGPAAADVREEVGQTRVGGWKGLT